MTDLDTGDFVYQSDQELFLVALGEGEDSYLFAVHGWRIIGKDRIDQYMNDDRSKVHTEEEIRTMIAESDDEKTKEKFDKLDKLFESYKDFDLSEDGPEKNFALEDK